MRRWLWALLTALLLGLAVLPAFAQDGNPALENAVTVEDLQTANTETLDKVMLWGGGLVALVVLFAGFVLRQMGEQGNTNAKALVEFGNKLADTIPIDKVAKMAGELSEKVIEAAARTATPVDDILAAMLKAGIGFVTPPPPIPGIQRDVAELQKDVSAVEDAVKRL